MTFDLRSRRPWRTFGPALTVVLVAFGLGAWEAGRADRRAVPGSARWIWLAGDWQRTAPVAFFAATDVWLDEVPENAVLRVVGDEEVLVRVNGWRAGGRRYRQGDPAAGYSVAPYLRPGGNRLLLEVRSSRGGGGLLAWLDTGPGQPGRQRRQVMAPTGPAWRLFRSPSAGLAGGWGSLEAGESPLDLGPPPRGRWGTVGLGPVLAGPEPATLRPVSTSPQRGRSLAPPSAWFRAWAERTFSPALWAATVLDWGEVSEGQLELRFGPGETGRGLLFFSLADPPDPRRDADALVVMPAGADLWQDAETRRFRYVLVVASRRPIAARILSTPPLQRTAVAGEPEPGDFGVRGVLGIQPPPLRAPMEDKLRREFEGLSLLGGGETG